jgi:hypothetical protein
MALTFGQMTSQILSETYRDASFSTQVQNAIVSAIKELEIEELFINSKFALIPVLPRTNVVPLPADFISVLQLNLLIGTGTSPDGSPPSPPPPPPLQPGTYSVINASSGFSECTFYDLQTYRYQFWENGTPGRWALFGNDLYLHPWADNYYWIDMWYYYRDNYPVYPQDTSIWLDDFTQDVTRYKARGIFYRDSLQSPELAASEFEKAGVALSQLRLRNSQRSTINNLSM